ncbi:hypothetical protein MMC22_001495 [Lobaria immixta]|nr:hypothetical protein [Lobaria immixta]
MHLAVVASSFFDPISINLGTYKEDFLDGATGANNPVYELWNEAKDTWDPEPILSNLKSFISIGTGVPSVEPFRTGLLEIGETLVRISTETEQTAESFQRSHSELDDSDRYFRFNVRNGLEHIALEDSSQRGDIMTLTERYVQSQDVFKLMKRCGRCLAEREWIRESWRDILQKISTYDHEKVHKHFSRKRLCTGSWFVEHASFRTWLDGLDPCFLWCTGNVGSGKTIITTAVVDAAKRKSRANGYLLSYFYCESAPRNMQQATGLFESLMKQSLIYLTVTQKTCPDSILVQIEELYRYGGPKRDFEDIVDIFSRLFRYFDTAIYVIDGLDELRDEGKIIVLNVFRDLFEQPGQQKLFISSRTEPHHNINMIHIIPNTKHIHVEQEKLEDIKYYIERRIAEKQRINRELTNDPCLIADIKSRLLSGSKGMFLWVHLQIEALWDLCFTENDIKNELDNLPKDLGSTYKRCLERIERNNNSGHARKVFRWVGCTSQSLHIDELKEAIAFTLEDRKWETGRIQSSRLIIERCANLVVQDNFDQHVRFVHPSVQQYLESRDHAHAFQIDRNEGQLECGEFSINYLSFSDFELQLSRDRSQSIALPSAVASPIIASTGGLGKMTSKFTNLVLGGSKRTLSVRNFHLPAVTSTMPAPDAAKYKFLPYAIENWAIDSKFITKNSQMWPSFKSLAIQPNMSWKIHPWRSGGQSHSSHLHGLLGWAVRNEHMPLLELLFDLRSEYDLHELYDKPLIKDGLPALHVASRLGYKIIFKRLLNFCGVNDLDYLQRTALHYAEEKGHEEIAEMLLKQSKGILQ